MNFGKKIVKGVLATLVTVVTGLSTAQAVDPDIAAIKHPHKLQQKWHDERAVKDARITALDRFDNDVTTIANGEYDEILTVLKDKWKADIKAAVNRHVGGDVDATHLFVGVPEIGGMAGGDCGAVVAAPAAPGMPALGVFADHPRPASESQGDFLTAINAVMDDIDETVVTTGIVGGHVTLPKDTGHKVALADIDAIRAHIAVGVRAILTPWLDGLANAGNTPTLVAAHAAYPGQPANNQRNSFRNFIRGLIK